VLSCTVFVFLVLYGCIHSIYKKCFKGRNNNNAVNNNVPYQPAQTDHYVPPHIIVYELPPANPPPTFTVEVWSKAPSMSEAPKHYGNQPTYPTGGAYNQPPPTSGFGTVGGGGGEADKYYNQPYGQGGTGYRTSGIGGGGGSIGWNNVSNSGGGYTSSPPPMSPPQHTQNLSTGSGNQIQLISCPPYGQR
jgi:hypothetical protein